MAIVASAPASAPRPSRAATNPPAGSRASIPVLLASQTTTTSPVSNRLQRCALLRSSQTVTAIFSTTTKFAVRRIRERKLDVISLLGIFRMEHYCALYFLRLYVPHDGECHRRLSGYTTLRSRRQLAKLTPPCYPWSGYSANHAHSVWTQEKHYNGANDLRLYSPPPTPGVADVCNAVDHCDMRN